MEVAVFDWQRKQQEEQERLEAAARDRAERRQQAFAQALEENPVDWEASVDSTPVTLGSYRRDAQEELRRILATQPAPRS